MLLVPNSGATILKVLGEEVALPKWPRHTEWSREGKTMESSETVEEEEKTNCFRVVDQSTIGGREKKGHPLNPLPLSPFVRSLCSLGRIYKDLGGKNFHSVRRTDERDGK